MDSAVTRSQPPPDPAPDAQHWGPRSVVVLIEGVLAGVVGTYLAAGSVVITAIAAGVAVIVLAMVLRVRH